MQHNNQTSGVQCNKELTLADIQRALDAVEAAFPKNEDGKPDFYGHKEEHKATAAKKKTLTDYQNRFTEKLVIGVAGAVMSLMAVIGSGLGDVIVQIIKGK